MFFVFKVFVVPLLSDRDQFLPHLWLRIVFSRLRASRECFGLRRTLKCHWSQENALCLVLLGVVTLWPLLLPYMVEGNKACLCITLCTIHRRITTKSPLLTAIDPFPPSVQTSIQRPALSSRRITLIGLSFDNNLLRILKADIVVSSLVLYGLFLGSSTDLFVAFRATMYRSVAPIGRCSPLLPIQPTALVDPLNHLSFF